MMHKMMNKTFFIERLRYVSVGRAGDYGSMEISVNCSMLVFGMKDPLLYVMVTPPGGDTFKGTSVQNMDTVLWEITKDVTGTSGIGHAEFVAEDKDGKRTSRVIEYEVSSGFENAEPAMKDMPFAFELVRTDGRIKTYAMTFPDGISHNILIEDGANGRDGKDGEQGEKGEKGEPGKGITGISKAGSAGLVDFYTITFDDGSTFDYTVKNGRDGSGSSGTDRDEKYGSGAWTATQVALLAKFRDSLNALLDHVAFVDTDGDLYADAVTGALNDLIQDIGGSVTKVLREMSVTPRTVTVNIEDGIGAIPGRIVVEAVYSDGERTRLENDVGYKLEGSIEAKTNTVRIVGISGYESLSPVDITVNVTEEVIAPVLTAIRADYENSTAVAHGTALDALTERVTAIYSDGSSKELTRGTDYTLSGNLSDGKTNTVTVTGAGEYAGFTATFKVTVEAAPAESDISALLKSAVYNGVIDSATSTMISNNEMDITEAGKTWTFALFPDYASDKSADVKFTLSRKTDEADTSAATLRIGGNGSFSSPDITVGNVSVGSYTSRTFRSDSLVTVFEFPPYTSHAEDNDTMLPQYNVYSFDNGCRAETLTEHKASSVVNANKYWILNSTVNPDSYVHPNCIRKDRVTCANARFVVFDRALSSADMETLANNISYENDGSTPINYPVSLSVSYNGGTVSYGTDLEGLTEVVNATMADGTVKTLTKGTDYVLSGSMSSGSNTITVYGRKQYMRADPVTFSVTVGSPASGALSTLMSTCMFNQQVGYTKVPLADRTNGGQTFTMDIAEDNANWTLVAIPANIEGKTQATGLTLYADDNYAGGVNFSTTVDNTIKIVGFGIISAFLNKSTGKETRNYQNVSVSNMFPFEEMKAGIYEFPPYVKKDANTPSYSFYAYDNENENIEVRGGGLYDRYASWNSTAMESNTNATVLHPNAIGTSMNANYGMRVLIFNRLLNSTERQLIIDNVTYENGGI